MRNAPSVVYPVGRSAFQAWLSVFIAGLSGAVVASFLFGLDAPAQGLWGWLTCTAGVLAWSVWAAWAFLSWIRSPEGVLRWSSMDGGEEEGAGAWSWTERTAAEPLELSELERVLDLQGRILLSIRGTEMGRRWIWVEQSVSPARWSDLRRALVASCA